VVLVAILALPLLPATGTDAHVTALSRTGAVSYSDYLGGSGSDTGWGIAVDGQGNAYVTGQTTSADFPTTPVTVSLTLGASAGASAGTCPGLGGLLGGLGGLGGLLGGVLGLSCPVSYLVQTGLLTTATLSVTPPATGTDAFVVKVSADGSSIGYSERLGSLGGLNALGDTWGRAIAVDTQGNAYVTGQTDSPDFPVTTLSPVGITNTASLVHGVCNPLTGLNTGTLTPTINQAITTTGGLCYDAFVTKLSPSYQGLNGRILYSTYLGGGRDDYGYGIATDGRGNAYVTGRTDSPDFPTTTGGTLDRASGTGGLLGTATYPACHETYCPDAFVARLDTTAGGLITVPPAVWELTGPVIGGVVSGVGGLLGLPIVGTAGAIVNGPTLTWSRVLGGSGADEGTAVALDPSGNVYVAGDTAPTSAGTTGDFPTTTGAYSTTTAAGSCPTGPCADVFVSKLGGSDGHVVYASRFGGSGDDKGAAIAVDTAGHAYVVGSTSSADFPLIGSLQGFAGTATGAVTTTMAFVTKLNIQGSALWYSSYLGGSGGDAGSAVAVDGIGDVALAGTTGSTDFLSLRPVARQELPTQAGQTQLHGSQGQPDAFVATIDATTRYLTYGYDNVDRLTGVTETLGNAYDYTYDPAGNRTDASLNGVDIQHLQYDAANEAITVTTPASTSIDSYDAAGNLTSDSTNSYRYDPLNRLIALTPSGPTGATGQPAQPETYAYNGDGTLVAQTAGTGSSAVTMRYTQDLATQPSLPGANGGPSTGLFAPTGHTPPPSQVLQARVTQSSGGDLVTDYAYGVDTGGNPARFASNPLGGGAHTWYVADPQGSPRYTQDDTGQPTGAGTPAGTLNYDPQPVRYAPYGAINLGADGNGQVPQTFGYRGELQDANTGLVNLRARTYNPATGQFLTRDPVEQQTGQAYAYAGGNPINNADPTGQRWVATTLTFNGSNSPESVSSSVEQDLIRRVEQAFVASSRADASGNHFALGDFRTFRGRADLLDLSAQLGPRSALQGAAYYLEPAPNQGDARVAGTAGRVDLGNFDRLRTDGMGTFAGISALNLTARVPFSSRIINPHGANGGTYSYCAGLDVVLGTTYPHHVAGDAGSGGAVVSGDTLQLDAAEQGGTYRIITRLLGTDGLAGQVGALGLTLVDPTLNGVNPEGFVRYTICKEEPGAGPDTCQGPGIYLARTGQDTTCKDESPTLCFLDLVLFNGAAGAYYRCQQALECGSALLGIVVNGFFDVTAVGDLVKAGRALASGGRTVYLGLRDGGLRAGAGFLLRTVAERLQQVKALVRSGVLARVAVGSEVRAAEVEADAQRIESLLDHTDPQPRGPDATGGCGCFVAGTTVATPAGNMPIENLRKGMQVLAEDPTTGKVEAEPVLRLITDRVSPLLAVELSDGTTLKVTADHPFWVDSGDHLARAGWLHAEHLRPGDRLRTAKGKNVVVVRVRRNAGHAVVYTLTVAHDHTFFVGSAKVLVHNCPVPVNELDSIAQVAEDLAKGNKRITEGRYHGDTEHNIPVSDAVAIVKNADGVYVTTGPARTLIFLHDGTISVVTSGFESRSATGGALITAYGKEGILGQSGARAIGGNALPTDAGRAITEQEILDGTIPTSGSPIPPAVKILPGRPYKPEAP